MMPHQTTSFLVACAITHFFTNNVVIQKYLKADAHITSNQKNMLMNEPITMIWTNITRIKGN